MAGELEPDQHLGRGERREPLAELDERRLEARPGDQYRTGLGAAAIRGTGHQHMEALPGVHPDLHRKRAGVGQLLIGGHSTAPGRGSRRSDYTGGGRVKRGGSGLIRV